jgi:hypothetical protein
MFPNEPLPVSDDVSSIGIRPALRREIWSLIRHVYLSIRFSRAHMDTRASYTGIRHQVGDSERRWPLWKASTFWICASLVLWALIIGGIYILL